jgi:hypothetical protein
MTDGFGPTPDDFSRWLQSQRREISGMRLTPATWIPTIDEPCGRYFTFRQLIECGATWQRTGVDNTPRSPDTFNALFELTRNILDPVVDYFGGIKLTYGFASTALASSIAAGIAPKLDQHASCELGTRGSPVCSRRGAAIDFLVEHENMKEVAQWIAGHCLFDRLYFYGEDRPIHVSYGPEMSSEAYEVTEKNGRRVPRRLRLTE